MASCPYCGRSCSCASNHGGFALPANYARDWAEAELKAELARFLATYELRAADKAAAQRAEALARKRPPSLTERVAQRNRVCSMAEAWRVA
jgi:hypothetical protein